MSRDSLLGLLGDIDTWCAGRDIARLDLVIMGDAALSLVWASPRLTRDLDVVVRGAGELDDLEAVFGKESGRRPWIDVVLAGLSAADYWMEEDIWEEHIEARRDRVLEYLDGRIREI